jgi:hypothetical protein
MNIIIIIRLDAFYSQASTNQTLALNKKVCLSSYEKCVFLGRFIPVNDDLVVKIIMA